MNQDREIAGCQRLMEQAPQIKVDGPGGEYRALAEFNNVVLAGLQTRYGMEYATWEWVQNHTSLWQGHYGDSYVAAKQDFITRSGLFPKERIFSDQQLAEIYRCIRETLESTYPITLEREKLLSDMQSRLRMPFQIWRNWCRSQTRRRHLFKIKLIPPI